MRIAVENIPDGVSNLELTCEIEELDLESEVVRFTGRVTAKLNLFKHDDKVYIKANSSVAT